MDAISDHQTFLWDSSSYYSLSLSKVTCYGAKWAIYYLRAKFCRCFCCFSLFFALF